MTGRTVLIVRESSGRGKEENIGQEIGNSRGILRNQEMYIRIYAWTEGMLKEKHWPKGRQLPIELEIGSQHSNCAESSGSRQELGYVSKKSWVYFNYYY